MQVESADAAIDAVEPFSSSSFAASEAAAPPTFEEEVNAAVQEWVLEQPAYRELSADDLTSPASTWADFLCSSQLLQQDQTLASSLCQLSDNADLRGALLAVSIADAQLTAALAQFADARANVVSIGRRAPVLYKLMGPKPLRSSFWDGERPVRGIVPLSGYVPAPGRSEEAIVFVHDINGFQYAVCTSRREVIKLNVLLKALAREHHIDGSLIGAPAVAPAVVSQGASRVGVPPTGSESLAGGDAAGTYVRGGAATTLVAGGLSGRVQSSPAAALTVVSAAQSPHVFKRRRLIPTSAQLNGHVALMMGELQVYKGKGYPQLATYGAFGHWAKPGDRLTDVGVYVRPGEMFAPFWALSCRSPSRAPQVSNRPSMSPTRPLAPCPLWVLLCRLFWRRTVTVFSKRVMKNAPITKRYCATGCFHLRQLVTFAFPRSPKRTLHIGTLPRSRISARACGRCLSLPNWPWMASFASMGAFFSKTRHFGATR